MLVHSTWTRSNPRSNHHKMGALPPTAPHVWTVSEFPFVSGGTIASNVADQGLLAVQDLSMDFVHLISQSLVCLLQMAYKVDLFSCHRSCGYLPVALEYVPGGQPTHDKELVAPMKSTSSASSCVACTRLKSLKREQRNHDKCAASQYRTFSKQEIRS